MKREEASTAEEFASVYAELVDWHIRLEGHVTLRSTATDFLLTGSLDAYENGVLVHETRREATIPRDLV